jgi:hypothetical protein
MIVVVIGIEKPAQLQKKRRGYLLGAACHPSAFFSTVATCLRTLLAVVNIVVLTLLSTSIADISTQIAKLLCKLAVH